VHRTLATSLLLLCAAACAAGVPAAAPVLGTWNGAHVSLELTATGGSVEFDCAHGEFQQPVVLDGDGGFDVPGRYVEEHGGPVRADVSADGFLVRYQGRVTGGRMTLTVLRADADDGPETFSLERGGESQLVKCR
jgi:hypothetical protein